jgi:enterochelin esterase-like enzyme
MAGRKGWMERKTKNKPNQDYIILNERTDKEDEMTVITTTTTTEREKENVKAGEIT